MCVRLGLLSCLALLGVAPPALAAADIEGTWSFSGGQVAIVGQPDGTFTGTIIRPTTLATCTHVVGEEMWTALRLQPDGQYFGRHQWFNDATCTYNPRGNTAYRVLQSNRRTTLRVCFANPESPALQPTIAADGSSANTTNGCVDSDRVAPPSGAPSLATMVRLPSVRGRACLRARTFRIRLREPAGDALAQVTVAVDGKVAAAVTRRRIDAPIVLRDLPRGRYTVQITIATVLGRTVEGTRTYRTCSAAR